MLRHCIDQHNPVGTIQIASLDLVQPSIAPVELPILLVDGDAVWHFDVGLDDRLDFVAIRRACTLNGSLVVPIRPVDVRRTTIDCNASRLVGAAQLDQLLDRGRFAARVRAILLRNSRRTDVI